MPPIENVNLYYSFFNYHQGLVNTMTAAQAANPATGAQLNQQMATLLQVDTKDLPAVIANTQQVTQAYAKLSAAGPAGLAAPKGMPALTPAQQASAYAFHKVRLTVGGVATLFQQISPASWSGLHSYIVGTYQTTIFKP